MPVDGVKVDEVIPDITTWNWNVAQKVKQLLTSKGEVTAKEIAPLVAEPSVKLRSVNKRISDNSDAIAILADAWYHHGTAGKGGTANRFTKSPSQ